MVYTSALMFIGSCVANNMCTRLIMKLLDIFRHCCIWKKNCLVKSTNCPNKLLPIHFQDAVLRDLEPIVSSKFMEKNFAQFFFSDRLRPILFRTTIQLEGRHTFSLKLAWGSIVSSFGSLRLACLLMS